MIFLVRLLDKTVEYENYKHLVNFPGMEGVNTERTIQVKTTRQHAVTSQDKATTRQPQGNRETRKYKTRRPQEKRRQ